jgi:hypothetical protein
MKKQLAGIRPYAITIVGLLFIMLFIISCYSYVEITGIENYKNLHNKSRVHVLQVQTNDDSLIFFNYGHSVKMKNNELIGPKLILPQNALFDSIIIKETLMKRYGYKDGIRYRMKIAEYDVGYSPIQPDSISIPFSEIRNLQYKQISAERTAGTILLTAGALVGITKLIAVVYIALGGGFSIF